MRRGVQFAYGFRPEFFFYGAQPTNCTNVLANSNMESDASWAIPRTTTFAATFTSDRFFNGARSLRTGIPSAGRNRYSYSTASQSALLPRDAMTITLNARVWRESTATVADYQFMRVVVEGPRGRMLNVFLGRSNAQRWEDVTFDLSAYKGQRVRVQLGTFNNGLGGKSAMYADDVAVNVCR